MTVERPTWCYHSYFSWPSMFGTACDLPHGHEGSCVFLAPAWVKEALDAGLAVNSPEYVRFFNDRREEHQQQPWDTPVSPGRPWTSEMWAGFEAENPDHICPTFGKATA